MSENTQNFLNHKLLKTIFLAVIPFLLIACASTPSDAEVELLSVASLCPSDLNWTEIQSGIGRTDFYIEEIKVNWTCIRVNLKTPGLNFYATPQGNQKGSSFSPKDVNQMAAELFPDAKTVITINTTPFAIEGGKTNPISIVKIQGGTAFPANSKYCALCFSQDDEAGFDFEILQSQSKQIEEYDWAIGGYYSILQAGEIIEFARYRHSRTACGLSEDGQYLYLFACTGYKDSADNSGLTFEECALILCELGCSDAMEFDGGHSTALVINGEDVIKPAMQKKIPATLSITAE